MKALMTSRPEFKPFSISIKIETEQDLLDINKLIEADDKGECICGLESEQSALLAVLRKCLCL